MRDDTHPCHDCGKTYFERMGSYWLADDALWARVVGTDTVVLCPSCFAERAKVIGLLVHWRPHLEPCSHCGGPVEIVGYDQHHGALLIRCGCCAPMPGAPA